MKSSFKKSIRILQIMPAAPGHRVAYADSDTLSVWTEAVVCWALVEEQQQDVGGRPIGEKRTDVKAMVHQAGACLDFATDNAITISMPGESTKDALERSGYEPRKLKPKAASEPA